MTPKGPNTVDEHQARAAFEAMQRDPSAANLRAVFLPAAKALEEHAELIITMQDDREALQLGERIYQYINDLGRKEFAVILTALCSSLATPRLDRACAALTQRLAFTDDATTEQHRFAAAWGLVEWVTENAVLVTSALLEHPQMQTYALRAFAALPAPPPAPPAEPPAPPAEPTN